MKLLYFNDFVNESTNSDIKNLKKRSEEQKAKIAKLKMESDKRREALAKKMKH